MLVLQLSKKDGTPITEFESYRELHQYIRNLENRKLVKDPLELGKTGWSFLIIPPDMVPELSRDLHKRDRLNNLPRALKEKQAIIEICPGNDNNSWLLPVSPDTDVEGFRQEFCEDYCDAHQLVIKECNFQRKAESGKVKKFIARLFRFIPL